MRGAVRGGTAGIRRTLDPSRVAGTKFAQGMGALRATGAARGVTAATRHSTAGFREAGSGKRRPTYIPTRSIKVSPQAVTRPPRASIFGTVTSTVTSGSTVSGSLASRS